MDPVREFFEKLLLKLPSSIQNINLEMFEEKLVFDAAEDQISVRFNGDINAHYGWWEMTAEHRYNILPQRSQSFLQTKWFSIVWSYSWDEWGKITSNGFVYLFLMLRNSNSSSKRISA
jgi:hypothetical protein